MRKRWKRLEARVDGNGQARKFWREFTAGWRSAGSFRRGWVAGCFGLRLIQWAPPACCGESSRRTLTSLSSSRLRVSTASRLSPAAAAFAGTAILGRAMRSGRRRRWAALRGSVAASGRACWNSTAPPARRSACRSRRRCDAPTTASSACTWCRCRMRACGTRTKTAANAWNGSTTGCCWPPSSSPRLRPTTRTRRARGSRWCRCASPAVRPP